MRKIFMLLLAASGILVACKHNNDVAPAASSGTGTGGGGVTWGVTDTALCFERDILPVFIANCAQSGCHDAASHQKGYIFTSYQTITASKFTPGDASNCELYEKIRETRADKIMPPPPHPPLSPQQIALIYSWIQRGAPNTGNCAAVCDTNNTGFSSGILPITQKYCKGCHSSAAPSSGVSLDNYAGVKAVALNGNLMGALKHQAGYPAMPQGGGQLSDCQIRQFEKWIAAGALNN